MKQSLDPRIAQLIEKWRKLGALFRKEGTATDYIDCADESIATMLGWENVPPQNTLEAEIRALKARAQSAPVAPPSPKYELDIAADLEEWLSHAVGCDRKAECSCGLNVALETLTEDIDKRLEASAPVAPLDGWQPIATAPKDGTWILLRGESGYIKRPYRVHVAHWDAEYRPHSPWQTSESCAFEDDGDAPTHWMPLPPSPVTPGVPLEKQE